MSYTYDLAGRRASLTVPGQAVANYSFDNANRLTQITQGSATVSFSYDNANRRSTLTLPNGITTSYSYDNASQLTAQTYGNGPTAMGSLTYGYDLNGRRANVGGSFAAMNLPNAVSTTAYNANSQLTSWGTASLFYDTNGNMTSDGTHSYTWDARNHLKQIDSGTTASFVYDPAGRRVSKNIAGSSTSFLYDGANAVQEVIGGTNTANSLMGGIDEVFQRTDSAGARNFLPDAMGSTLALTDSSGAIQTQYSFEPFGKATQTGSSSTNTFTYTGRELDATGLYFNRARYYNPLLQRFISEDPIGFKGGDVNLYAYVGNNPIRFKDPGGLIRDPVGFPIGGGVPGTLNGRYTPNPDYCKVAGSVGPWSPDIQYVPSTGHFFFTGLGGGISAVTFGVALTCGWIIQTDALNPVNPDNFVQGAGGGVCGFYGVGGCVTEAPNGLGLPSTAFEGGIGTPNFGVSGGYTNQVPDLGRSWQPDPHFPGIPIGDGLYYYPDVPDPSLNP